MLAHAAPRPFDSPDHWFEVKWDGYRALARADGKHGQTRLESRNLVDLTPRFPDLATLHRAVEGRRAILDGEIVAWGERGPEFGRLHGGRPAPVLFVAFDLLYLDGADLRARPWLERRELLAGLLAGVPPGQGLAVSEAIPRAGRALFVAVRARGLEGVMAKRGDSPYLDGQRSRHWLKVRNVRRGVAVVVGYTAEGGRVVGGRRFGSLLLGAYDAGGFLVYVGHAGTGFDQRTVAELLDRLEPRETPPLAAVPREARRSAVQWVEPRHVCRLEYSEVTPDGRLRHPSYQGLEPDMDPRECTVARLEEGELGPP